MLDYLEAPVEGSMLTFRDGVLFEERNEEFIMDNLFVLFRNLPILTNRITIIHREVNSGAEVQRGLLAELCPCGEITILSLTGASREGLHEGVVDEEGTVGEDGGEGGHSLLIKVKPNCVRTFFIEI